MVAAPRRTMRHHSRMHRSAWPSLAGTEPGPAGSTITGARRHSLVGHPSAQRPQGHVYRVSDIAAELAQVEAGDRSSVSAADLAQRCNVSEHTGQRLLAAARQYQERPGAQQGCEHGNRSTRSSRTGQCAMCGAVRALTRRTSQLPIRAVLMKINTMTRGTANYFRHAVAKHAFAGLHQFIWWRVVNTVRRRHRRRGRGYGDGSSARAGGPSPGTGSSCMTSTDSGHPVPVARTTSLPRG